MITSIPITKLRINLGAFVKRARLNKESFVLEKDGFPVAGLVDIDTFEDLLEMRDVGVNKNLDKSYKEYKKGGTSKSRTLLR